MQIEAAGQVRPSRAQRSDIAFGWPLLVELVAMNASSALAVREGDVIAVHGAEDLAAMIDRTGRLCRRRGWSLLLADGAAILDLATLTRLRRARAGCVAMEAGPSPSPEVLEAARKCRIAVVQIAPGHQADG